MVSHGTPGHAQPKKSGDTLMAGNNGHIRRGDWIWLGVILGVAIVLRSINLGSGLWYDEIQSLVEFVRLPPASLITSLSSLNNHILYSLEAHAAIAAFGESAWALRLPAMIFGVASVGMLWWFARRIVSAPEANMAALLLAVSYHHIWFSQNARGYTGLMFWAIAGTALFIRGIHRPSWPVWVGYAFVLAAAAYTHLSAGFFFMIHGLVYLALVAMRDRLKRRYPGISGLKPMGGFILGGVLILLLHAPLVPQLINNVSTASGHSETAVRVWKNPIWTLLEIGRNVQDLGLLAVIGLPAVLIFFGVGAFSLSRRQPIFVAITLVHIPLTFVALVALSFRIWPRYFFIDLAFVFLCLIHGVFVFANYLARSVNILGRFSLGGERVGMVGSLLAVFCSLFLLPPNYRYPKQDFLGARDFVDATRTQGDAVATIGMASYAFSKYYEPSWQAAESWEDLQRIRSLQRRVWLVYTSTLHTSENYPEILKHLATDFELVKQFPGTLGDGTVFVYRSRASVESELRP